MSSFQDMAFGSCLHKSLSAMKFEKPTEVQKTVIPIALEGKDIVVCAETGSGKTAAYGIPTISHLTQESNLNRRALVLAPTRELVQQIAEFFRKLVAFDSRFHVVSLVGGADIRKQFQALKRKPNLIVATPGRLNDHLKRKTVQLGSTDILILDEGDRMLDMGFAPQLDEILKFLPKKRQTMLFTATLSDRVLKLGNEYMEKPKVIRVGQSSLPAPTIKQSVVEVASGKKNDRIVDELNQRQGSVIVFLRTKQRTDQLARVLSEYGFSVGLIHGGRSQGQRNLAIQNLRSGKVRILCATDVAARGIDIPLVQHIINFDLPMMPEDYVHRVGRTGRFGSTGEAVTFVSPEDRRSWQNLARRFKIQSAPLLKRGPNKI